MTNQQNAGGVCVEVHGKTLRETLSHMPLADRLQLLPAFLNLCRVVGTAHARGVVHRALHPGQILVTESGDMLVMDWGLSKQRGRQDPHEERFAQAVAQLRKDEEPLLPLDPACLAPEIILGHVEDVDAHSDVYSLGAILYEILAGRPLYGGSAPEILEKALTGGWRAVSDYEPDAPAELIEVYRRALCREPSARFANARQMARELRLLFEETTPGATHTVASGEAGRYRRILILNAVALAVLVIVFGVVLRHATRQRDAAKESVRMLNEQLHENQARFEERIQTLTENLHAAQMERDAKHEALAKLQQEYKAAKDALGRLLDATVPSALTTPVPADTQTEKPQTAESPASLPAPEPPAPAEAKSPAPETAPPSAEPPPEASAKPAPEKAAQEEISETEEESSEPDKEASMPEEEAADETSGDGTSGNETSPDETPDDETSSAEPTPDAPADESDADSEAIVSDDES